MNLSGVDLINKYYSPCEHTIRQALEKICKHRHDLLISFIDVVDQACLKDQSNNTIITDQLINRDLYPDKNILKLPDSIFGIYYVPTPLENQQISLDFNLFINRADINRMFWFYKIVELDWLESGAVSYIGSTARSTHPDLTSVEFLDLLYQKYFFPNYQHQHDFARKCVPYQNFQDTGDLRKIMMQTKLSIVIETYHERTDAISFSEKIFRALQVPRPWALIAATGSVSRLRSMGFDVFDDYVDHSYDSWPSDQDVTKQTDHIINEIARFKQLKITQDILDDWYRIYQNNLAVLASWHQSWRDDFKQFISGISNG